MNWKTLAKFLPLTAVVSLPSRSLHSTLACFHSDDCGSTTTDCDENLPRSATRSNSADNAAKRRDSDALRKVLIALVILFISILFRSYEGNGEDDGEGRRALHPVIRKATQRVTAKVWLTKPIQSPLPFFFPR
jgi:hypothetical protein